jgi:hypothetical protein
MADSGGELVSPQLVDNSSSALSDTTTVDHDSLLVHVRSIVKTLLGGSEHEMDVSFGDRYNAPASLARFCDAFSADPEPRVLFVLKDVLSGDGKCICHDIGRSI